VTDEMSPATSTPGRVLGLQQLDTAIAQHEHRKAALPERVELAAVEREASALRRRMAQVEGERQTLLDHQGELEDQTASITARRRTLEDHLYGARGAAGRDLSVIETEITQLNRRRAEIEEIELQLLVDQEPLDVELEEAERRSADLADRAAVLRAAAAAADSEIDAELVDLRRSRTEAASSLPADLLELYERLRAHLGGVGAARLVGNRCDGCHLELPSVEVDRIRHLPPDEIVTCEQCGRLLVRVAAAPPSG
jgi:uncharacterized protein